MKRLLHIPLTAAFLLLGFNHEALAQHSLPKAEMYLKNGLPDDAKREAIGVIFSSRDKGEVAGAKLLLAQTAVEEGRLSNAVELWQDIINANSGSPAAASAQMLLSQVASLVGSTADQTVDNATAKQYFSSAEFWLKGLEYPYPVDTSWLPTESAAVYWLDKIIFEFPATPSAERAMYLKARAYLGAKGHGEAGVGGFGVLGMITEIRGSGKTTPREHALKDLMAKAKEALAQLEGAFPESRYLSILKFMIADTYWLTNNKESATPWLEQVINATRTESLWSQLARLRQDFWRG